jgi:proton glutamate symport protein
MVALKEPLLLAFTTSSSESAMPQAIKCLEKLGLPNSVVSFVLPTGYSFNLDGSTLYLSLATLFVAQLANIHLGWEQQLLILLSLLVTSKGVAAVPRTSLVILTATLAAFKLPVEGVGVILGIDFILDMGRTTINLLGNCVASAVIAKWEGLSPFGDKKADMANASLRALAEKTVLGAGSTISNPGPTL